MSPTETIENLSLSLVPGKQLILAGTLTSDSAQTALRERFTELHADIEQRALRAFNVDLRRLEFVNSSSIRLFVDWISRAETAGYKLVFEIDPAITWHRLSFSVLQTLAPQWVELVEHGSASAAHTDGDSQ
jgi:ABC-type transporter Mla MlaB component